MGKLFMCMVILLHDHITLPFILSDIHIKKSIAQDFFAIEASEIRCFLHTLQIAGC